MRSAQHREGSCSCHLLPAGRHPPGRRSDGEGKTQGTSAVIQHWGLDIGLLQGSWNPADVLKPFIPAVARRLVMSLGSRILDVFLVQAFGLVTFGSLGNVQGSREGMELTGRGGLGRGLQYPRESVKGCVGPRLRVAEGSYSSGKICTST